jgi:hypothetical protein
MIGRQSERLHRTQKPTRLAGKCRNDRHLVAWNREQRGSWGLSAAGFLVL